MKDRSCMRKNIKFTSFKHVILSRHFNYVNTTFKIHGISCYVTTVLQQENIFYRAQKCKKTFQTQTEENAVTLMAGCLTKNHKSKKV